MALYSPRHSRPLPSAARAAAAAAAADHPPTGVPAPALLSEPVESVFSIVKRARVTPFATPTPARAPIETAAALTTSTPGTPKPKSKAANLRRAAKSATAARARRARLAAIDGAGIDAGGIERAGIGAGVATVGPTSAVAPAAVETTDVIESVSAAVVPHPALRRRSMFDDIEHEDDTDDEPRRAVWLRPRALAGAAAAAMIVVALGATSLAQDGAPASGNTGAAGNPRGAVSLPANVVNDSQRIPVGATVTSARPGQRGPAGAVTTAAGHGGVAGSTATTAGGVESRPAGSSAGGGSTVRTSASHPSTPAGPTTSAGQTHPRPPTSSKPKPPPPSVTCIINILGIRVCLPI